MTQSSKLSITFTVTVIISVALSFVLGLSGTFYIPVYMNLLLSQALIVIPAFCYLKKEKKKLRRVIPDKGLSLWAVVCLIAFVFAVQPLMLFLNYVSSLFFGSGTEELSRELAAMPLLFNLIFVAVIPAWSEETVFRGIYFQGFRRHGFWKAALVSGLFFGLMHLNWNQFSYGFVLGVLFAFLVEATGSIRASMIVHFGINFQSALSLSSLQGMTEEEYELAMAQGKELLYGNGMQALYGSYLFLAAAVSAGVCVLLIWLLTKASERSGYMNWVLWGGEKKHLQTFACEPLFSPSLAAAVVIPAGFMCLFQIL